MCDEAVAGQGHADVVPGLDHLDELSEVVRVLRRGRRPPGTRVKPRLSTWSSRTSSVWECASGGEKGSRPDGPVEGPASRPDDGRRQPLSSASIPTTGCSVSHGKEGTASVLDGEAHDFRMRHYPPAGAPHAWAHSAPAPRRPRTTVARALARRHQFACCRLPVRRPQNAIGMNFKSQQDTRNISIDTLPYPARRRPHTTPSPGPNASMPTQTVVTIDLTQYHVQCDPDITPA